MVNDVPTEALVKAGKDTEVKLVQLANIYVSGPSESIELNEVNVTEVTAVLLNISRSPYRPTVVTELRSILAKLVQPENIWKQPFIFTVVSAPRSTDVNPVHPENIAWQFCDPSIVTRELMSMLVRFVQPENAPWNAWNVVIAVRLLRSTLVMFGK